MTVVVLYISTDVDECATSNGGCAHNCTNTVPGFACGCRDGFLLNSDGFSCDGGCNAPLYCMLRVSLAFTHTKGAIMFIQPKNTLHMHSGCII